MVRIDSWRLPATQSKRDALAAAYGADGFTLLRAVYAADAPYWLAQIPAVDVLRQVLLQNCDCLATVAARALHVLPAQASVYAAAVKFLVPNLLHETNYNLSLLLGARSYLREGPPGVFQKNTRDLSVAMLAHASSVACQATIIPQLAQLARRSWLTAEAPPPSLFRVGAPLPELDFASLSLSAKGHDNLSATLLIGQDGSAAPELAALCDHLVAVLTDLKRRCEDIAPRDRTVAAGPASFDLAERYATLLAASACLGVWRYNQDSEFLGDPAGIVAVLRRLADRLGAPAGVGGTAGDGGDLERRLYAELLARHEAGRAFDLTAAALAGRRTVAGGPERASSRAAPRPPR